MCVIAICKYTRLTDEQVEQMWDANNFGGGAAWREPKVDANGLVLDEFGRERLTVKWHKALDKDEMLEKNKTLPFPYVLHFRVPSQDTSKNPLACHPFAVNNEASFDYEGETDDYVLFHNGYWTGWREQCKTIAMQGFVRIPSGPWSDSRGLAWAASHLGKGFLEMVNEKTVVFAPYDIDICGTWQIIKNPDEEGKDQPIYVSNLGWERPFTKPTATTGEVIAVNDRRRTDITALATQADRGAAAQGSFCGGPSRVDGQVPSGRSDEEEVQSGGEGTGEALLSNVSRMCQQIGCTKRTRSGLPYNNKFYCMQCWAQATKKEAVIGECEVCKVQRAATKTKDTNQWICYECWDTNGHPEIRLMIAGKEGE